MQVTMLGPLEVRTDDDSGIVLDVGGARLRALLIMLALRPGQLVPASQLIDGLLVAHPMREPLAARLMRGLHACGRRGGALAVYEQTKERLVDQLGIEPSAELAALHLAILRADDPPVGPAHHTSPTNLRAELTSFVGRDTELAYVAELLSAHRLVTLTGPGGAGKTRLAVEAARAELAATPDGVWLVELASITDPADLTLIGPLSALFGTFHTHRVMQPSVFDDAVANPEPWVSATALVMRGHVGLNFGRQHVAAEEDFLAATGIFSGLGERWGLAIALSGLAMLEGWRGEHAAAADHYRRATELSAEIGSAEDEVHFRLDLAQEIWLLGERDAAYAELARAQRDAERLKLPEAMVLAAYTAGDLARLDGDLEVARAELTRVTELGGPPDIVLQLRAMCATALGYLAAAGGDLAAARRWHAQALEAARSSVDAPVIAQALTGLADLALREADPDRAELGAVGFEVAYQRGQSVTTDTLAALVPLAQPALKR